MSTGLLLKCVAVRHLWRSNSTATVSTVRGGTARHWCSLLPDVIIITPVLRQLHWLPVKQRTDQFTSHCMVLLRRSCRTTVNSSRTCDFDISGLLASTRVSSRGHSHRLATGVSLYSRTAAMEQPIPTEIRKKGTTFGHYRRLLKASLFV